MVALRCIQVHRAYIMCPGEVAGETGRRHRPTRPRRAQERATHRSVLIILVCNQSHLVIKVVINFIIFGGDYTTWYVMFFFYFRCIRGSRNPYNLSPYVGPQLSLVLDMIRNLTTSSISLLAQSAQGWVSKNTNHL